MEDTVRVYALRTLARLRRGGMGKQLVGGHACQLALYVFLATSLVGKRQE
jgi:hypothetical protein